MQAFILIGDLEKQQEYLDSFQKDNSVPSYLIVRFEAFKILDARTLQKTLALKLHQDDKRMVVISSPTLDAQHAILKTIEELPESVYVFFLVSGKDDLIPTILSRSQEIFAGEESKVQRVKGAKVNLKDILGGVEVESLQDVERVIKSVRELLLDQITKYQDESQETFQVLKRLSENYLWAKNNNVNRKMAVEVSTLGNKNSQ